MILYEGNCLQEMKKLPDNSVDSIVTDPPYGLSFLGKKWDYDVPSVEIWREALRVLKPGGHLLSFAGSRTYHRMAVNIEDAGFEIRDQIMWVYGSGFPKSLSVSKAIDKAAGKERKVIGKREPFGREGRKTPMGFGEGNVFGEGSIPNEVVITEPATPEAEQWDGWGTALKPAHEPIVVARKPLIGTVVENVLEHGSGGLNIDACRVGMMTEEEVQRSGKSTSGMFAKGGVDWKNDNEPQGRFPANFIHDGSDEVVSQFPDTKGGSGGAFKNDSLFFNENDAPSGYTDSGSAARFFYCAKASKAERSAGLENNIHPTVKPVDLMKYLCRLVTPPNGIVLDPFMGSGTTGIAAKVEGFNFIGIEMNVEYLAIAESRINHWVEEYEIIHKTKHEWI